MNHSPSASDAFAQWFGDSKVVDVQGCPLVVYHGTDKPWATMRTLAERLAQFDENTRGVPEKYVKAEREIIERAGGAVWFTDDLYVANEYADCSMPEKIVEAFVALQSPLDLRELEIAEIERILTEAHGWEQKVSTEYGTSKGIAQAVVRDNTRLIQWAKEHGYDGLIHPDTDIRGRGVHTSYVAFYPEQVKTVAEIGRVPAVGLEDVSAKEEDDDRPAFRF